MAVGADTFSRGVVGLLVPVQVPFRAESVLLSTTIGVVACMVLDVAAPMLSSRDRRSATKLASTCYAGETEDDGIED